jgi:hypothetical protein
MMDISSSLDRMDAAAMDHLLPFGHFGRVQKMDANI